MAEASGHNKAGCGSQCGSLRTKVLRHLLRDQADTLAEVALGLAKEFALPKDGPDSQRFDWQLLFTLARRIQGVLARMGYRVELAALQILQPIVEVFRKEIAASELDFYTDITVNLEDAEECWVAFCSAWGKVKVPEGVNVLEAAYLRGLDRPIRLTADMKSPGAIGVASMAYHLQLTAPDEVIVLPVDRVGELLGRSRRHAGRVISNLRDLGLLELVKAADHPRRRAAEHRFNLHATTLFTPPESA